MTELERNKDLLLRIATLAADAAVARIYPQLDELSKHDAEQLHGRKWLDYHISAGTITPHRKGSAKNSKMVFSRLEINAVWQAEMLSAKILEVL